MQNNSAMTPLILGYIEVGSMIAMVLFGMSTVQVYMYFSYVELIPYLILRAHSKLRGCSRDKLVIRAVVS